jgi:hypothetical protein
LESRLDELKGDQHGALGAAAPVDKHPFSLRVSGSRMGKQSGEWRRALLANLKDLHMAAKQNASPVEPPRDAGTSPRSGSRGAPRRAAAAPRRANVATSARTADPASGTLRHIGGSQSDHWNDLIALETIEARQARQADTPIGEPEAAAALAGIAGIAPGDEVEAIMAAQLVAGHGAVMACYRRAMINAVPYGQRRDDDLRNAGRLSRACVQLIGALQRYRATARTEKSAEQPHAKEVLPEVASRLDGLRLTKSAARRVRVEPWQLHACVLTPEEIDILDRHPRVADARDRGELLSGDEIDAILQEHDDAVAEAAPPAHQAADGATPSSRDAAPMRDAKSAKQPQAEATGQAAEAAGPSPAPVAGGSVQPGLQLRPGAAEAHEKSAEQPQDKGPVSANAPSMVPAVPPPLPPPRPREIRNLWEAPADEVAAVIERAKAARRGHSPGPEPIFDDPPPNKYWR